MKRTFIRWTGMAVFLLLLMFHSAYGADPSSPEGMLSKTAEVQGVKIHYLTAGHGPTVLLLHGYAQTSRMWRPLIPLLAKRFTVIAPDLPGIGDSSIPATGLDMKNAAITLNALVRSLGVQKARVVGHDIGLMVAYAYAAQFPNETEKLVVMDAFLPGVGEWQAIYDNPEIWHFRFHGKAPEALVEGRERIFLDSLWDGFSADKTHSVPEVDRRAYTVAYSKPGRMRAGWAYFAALPQTGQEFSALARTKLNMPVLSMGGEKSLGPALAQQMKLAATNITVLNLKDTGHWLMEERPQETMRALEDFL